MKGLFNCLAFIALTIISSCVRLAPEPVAGASFELTGILETEPASRTYIQGATGGIYYPYWSGDERLAVFCGGADVPAAFDLKSGKGTPTATFTGPSGGNGFVAFYPEEAIGDMTGKVLHFSLPAEQPYVPGSFGNGFFPMLAVSNTSTLKFKNLCSVLKVSLTGSTEVASISFIPNDPKASVCGSAYVQTDRFDDPVLTMEDGGGASVTLLCGGISLSEDNPTSFLLVIPPGTYKGGFTLKIKTSEGTVFRTTDKDVVMLRSQLRSIPAFKCEGGELYPEDLPENVICYKTAHGFEVNVDPSKFEHKVVSHYFNGDMGVITFDGALSAIGDFAFAYTNLTEVYLPHSIESIGSHAFFETLLTTFMVPDKLKSVGSMAFGQCGWLSSFSGSCASKDGRAIVINDQVVAYIGTPGETISLPEGTKTMASNCLSLVQDEKEKLRELILPEGFTTMGSNFSSMPMLEYITLPSTYKTAFQCTFSDCPRLKKFKGNCPYIRDDGNILMDNEGYVSDFAGAGISDYVLPEGVLYLEDRVFSGKPDLRSLTFPQSFKDFINRPFNDAPNLSRFYGKYVSEDGVSLVIDGTLRAVAPAIEYYTSPAGVNSVGGDVFGSKVKAITFDDCVTTIQNYALFNATNLQTLVFPASLKAIGQSNFYYLGNLEKMYFRSSVPPSCMDTGSPKFRQDLVVYVPRESLSAYRQSSLSFLARYMQGYDPEDLPEYYSIDGEVTVMQTATKGAGIDLVLMGDAFTQEEIENGTYGAVMNDAAEAFFAVEPYKSFRNLFNVYRVDVVSQTSGYSEPGQALGTSFGEGTNIKGNDSKCVQYARIAVPADRMDNVLVLVVLNSDRYAGTCYMYGHSGFTGDWGEGYAVAYVPLGSSKEMMGQVVRHEAGGHGFAKLEDEYYYESNGTIPQDVVSNIMMSSSFGWSKNVDFTADPSAVKWQQFLSDSRYSSEDLGVFEGAATYPYGVYRPSHTSIMDNNKGIFNAPSRYAIWYRIIRLAYGPKWEAEYEDFVTWDARNRVRLPSHVPGVKEDRQLPPLARPVVKQMSWQELIGE